MVKIKLIFIEIFFFFLKYNEHEFEIIKVFVVWKLNKHYYLIVDDHEID